MSKHSHETDSIPRKKNQKQYLDLLASLGNWKEGGARLPRDFERLEDHF